MTSRSCPPVLKRHCVVFFLQRLAKQCQDASRANVSESLRRLHWV